MFKRIDEAVEWISNHRNQNLGFDHFKDVMNLLDNPQDKLRIVHVAGTNGKGSTINFLKDILCVAGVRVGTFQSPHLIQHQDRIRIDSADISDEDFLMIVNGYYNFFIEHKLNMFEMDYIIMCRYFLDQKVDIALVEVGLGGRLDATNVVTKPLLSIITTIGFDHQDKLGNSLIAIASEKAGIIKQDSNVLIGHVNEEVKAVIRDVAEARNNQLYEVGEYTNVDEYKFEYQGIRYQLATMALYQRHNASVAIRASQILKYDISIDNIKKAVKTSLWEGRFHKIHNKPEVYIDGAHNIEGIEALIASFKYLKRPIRCLTSVLNDKDYQQMFDLLNDNADELYITTFDFYRAMSITQLHEVKKGHKIDDYRTAIDSLLSDEEGTIVICGSLYFISDVLIYFKDKFKKTN